MLEGSHFRHVIFFLGLVCYKGLDNFKEQNMSKAKLYRKEESAISVHTNGELKSLEIEKERPS